MVRDPLTNQWWVVYSAGSPEPGTLAYQIVASPCAAVNGPCDQSQLVHLITSNSQGNGPGEQSLLTDPQGREWLAYDVVAPFLAQDGMRQMALVRLGFGPTGIPYVGVAGS